MKIDVAVHAVYPYELQIECTIEHNIFTTSSMHTDRLENAGKYYSCESHSNLEAVRVLVQMAEYGRVRLSTL